jgi:hypothetical protein
LSLGLVTLSSALGKLASKIGDYLLGIGKRTTRWRALSRTSSGRSSQPDHTFIGALHQGFLASPLTQKIGSRKIPLLSLTLRFRDKPEGPQSAHLARCGAFRRSSPF